MAATLLRCLLHPPMYYGYYCYTAYPMYGWGRELGRFWRNRHALDRQAGDDFTWTP